MSKNSISENVVFHETLVIFHEKTDFEHETTFWNKKNRYIITSNGLYNFNQICIKKILKL
jgi:hypothetical protein